jgi:hypothetical protein
MEWYDIPVSPQVTGGTRTGTGTGVPTTTPDLNSVFEGAFGGNAGATSASTTVPSSSNPPAETKNSGKLPISTPQGKRFDSLKTMPDKNLQNYVDKTQAEIDKIDKLLAPALTGDRNATIFIAQNEDAIKAYTNIRKQLVEELNEATAVQISRYSKDELKQYAGQVKDSKNEADGRALARAIDLRNGVNPGNPSASITYKDGVMEDRDNVSTTQMFDAIQKYEAKGDGMSTQDRNTLNYLKQCYDVRIHEATK